MSGAAFRGAIGPAMSRALALVAGGMSQRKAAKAAAAIKAGREVPGERLHIG